jgi:hypothetical protein
MLHLMSSTSKCSTRIVVKVDKTAITTDMSVIVEHRQLNGFARSSQRSRHERGQMDSDFSGERIARGPGMSVFGTHADDIAHQEHGSAALRQLSHEKWSQHLRNKSSSSLQITTDRLLDKYAELRIEILSAIVLKKAQCALPAP